MQCLLGGGSQLIEDVSIELLNVSIYSLVFSERVGSGGTEM